MDNEAFKRKMQGEYSREFGIADIATFTPEQANTLCDRLIKDVALMDSQREQRRAAGTADSAWLTKSGVAKHYRLTLVRLIREHFTAADIKSGFSDPRCRALYGTCDALVDIIQRLQDAGTQLTSEDAKDVRSAESLLDSVEDAVNLASLRAGELRSEFEKLDGHHPHGVSDELTAAK